MFDEMLDDANKAYRAYDEKETERIIGEIAKRPEEALPIMLQAFFKPDKIRRSLAIQAIRVIGYPQNIQTIPTLVSFLGDPNDPGWLNAVCALTDMGPKVVVPHLIAALLEKGKPYHDDKGEWWADDVEGICCMLICKVTDREYARLCCPTINYLLSIYVPHQELDISFLLRVVEKAEIRPGYMLPTLIMLARQYQEDEVGNQVRALLETFNQEDKQAYGYIGSLR